MHAQTKRQREVLDFITQYIEARGFRPSYQIIARKMGVSSRSGIARIVRDLESQGLLTRVRENGNFAIELGRGRRVSTAEGSGLQIDWLEVPRADDDREAWQDKPFALPEFMLGAHEPEKIRAFLVPDDGMAGDGICRNDVALIELREFVRDGKCVVAVIDGEQAILRRYNRAGADIELSVSDDDDQPMRFAGDRVEIKGMYRGLLRPA